MRSQTINRRDFLKFAGFGGMGLLLGGQRPWGTSTSWLATPPGQMEAFVPDAEISLTAAEKTVQILPGAPTRVWSYEGQLLSGTGVTVQNLPGCYLGPILRVQSGTKVRLFFHNNLAEDSVVHPHGLRVPEDCDGQPMHAIGPGETKVYEFQVIDQAGPHWFHPHPHMRTAEQVLMGLAGLFHVWDEQEQIAVPGAGTGANDLPLIIQDRTFDSSNQFLYQPNNMWGFLGDRILVNGQVNAALSLEPRAYRLRLLNGSNARTYKVAWSNGMPLQVIGTDGGLLPQVATHNYVMLMPGERIDLWADFAQLARKQVILRSLTFDPGMGSALPMGAQFDILTINVGRRASVKPVLGPLPPLSVRYAAGNVPNYATPRPFTLEMHQMVWTINGRVYEMEGVAEDEIVHLNETMAWEWINNSPIPHPMHIHNVQFQVVERTAPSTSSYATINQGLVDGGWKDTVLVWPGEKVKVAMHFGPHAGMYMYHCHILEHEDMTMMRNYMIMDPVMPGM